MYHQNNRNTVSTSPVKLYLEMFRHSHNIEDSFKPVNPGSRSNWSTMLPLQLGLPSHQYWKWCGVIYIDITFQIQAKENPRPIARNDSIWSIEIHLRNPQK